MIRNIDAGDYLESFLVSGVAMLLGVRLYLELTGYPQIGGDGLHIAHMLWGGLLMVVAQVLLLGFLGRKAHRIAAIAGGAGFGLFIDELGKFITSDNNYFFRPAIALIYVVFVLLYLAFRLLDRRGALLTPDAYLVNALALLGEAATGDLDREERDEALACLAKSDPANPLTIALKDAIGRVDLVASRRPNLAERAVRRSRRFYKRFVRSSLFRIVVIGGFILYVLVTFGGVIGAVVSDPKFERGNWALSPGDWGHTIASLLSAALALIGIVRLRASRLDAYRWFKRAVLVAIFLTQFFAFYSEQLVALIGLALNLLLLIGLDYALGEETTDSRLSAGDAPAASAGDAVPTVAGR